MDATTTPQRAALPAPLFAGPFEGSERAADIVGRVQGFLLGELAELAREHGIDHERGADRALLQRVWRRSHELGSYGMTLPAKMGGLGLTVLDHVLIKEAIYATGSPFAPHVFGELSGPPRLGALARQATPHQLDPFAHERACCVLQGKRRRPALGSIQRSR